MQCLEIMERTLFLLLALCICQGQAPVTEPSDSTNNTTLHPFLFLVSSHTFPTQITETTNGRFDETSGVSFTTKTGTFENDQSVDLPSSNDSEFSSTEKKSSLEMTTNQLSASVESVTESYTHSPSGSYHEHTSHSDNNITVPDLSNENLPGVASRSVMEIFDYTTPESVSKTPNPTQAVSEPVSNGSVFSDNQTVTSGSNCGFSVTGMSSVTGLTRSTTAMPVPGEDYFETTQRPETCSHSSWCDAGQQHSICRVSEYERPLYVVDASSLCEAEKPPQRFITRKNSKISELHIKIHPGKIETICKWYIIKEETCDSVIQRVHVKLNGQWSENINEQIWLGFEQDGDATQYLNAKSLWEGTMLDTWASVVLKLWYDVPQYFDLHILFVLTIKNPLPVGWHRHKEWWYMSTPEFNGFSHYPVLVEGTGSFQLSSDQVILVAFKHFHLEESEWCHADFLEFLVKYNEDMSWKKCGYQTISPRIYHTDISLHFLSDDAGTGTGFMMAYAILPKWEEPQMISEGIFNCSIPFYASSIAVLRCNTVVECAGGEDEIDCANHTYSTQCKEGMIDAGTKCYRFVHHTASNAMSWSDAKVECLKRNEKLATFATLEEYSVFKNIVSDAVYFSGLYVGAVLSEDSGFWSLMYRYVWQWEDEKRRRTAFSIDISGEYNVQESCAFFDVNNLALSVCLCTEKLQITKFVCETEKSKNGSVKPKTVQKSLALEGERDWKVNTVRCPDGHVVRDFLRCDFGSHCGVDHYKTSCRTGVVEVPMFSCQGTSATVPYTVVCDHVWHCADGSDENFCHFSPCPLTWFQCKNEECIPFDEFCNGEADCVDFTDEDCGSEQWATPRGSLLMASPFWRVDMAGNGHYEIGKIEQASDCPDTHFLCSSGACLPVYLRCNTVDDCAGREDEAGCESYECPGFYRCWSASVCLHPEHVCDGVWQCPHFDDELLCNLSCPDACRCQGLAFVCRHSFNANSYPGLRYLDASGSGMDLANFEMNKIIIHLKLSQCQISDIHELASPNLRYLDLSWNNLRKIGMANFVQLKNLLFLDLSYNPLTEIVNSPTAQTSRMILETIVLSHSSFVQYNGTALANCPNLKTINMSWSEVHTIGGGGFGSTPMLAHLDVAGAPLTTFPVDVLTNLTSLKTVYTHNFKLCCPAMLPSYFDVKKCHAEPDLLASCDDLLKSNAYRVFLWVFAVLAIFGNVGSFVSRVYLDGTKLGSYSVFVTSLSLADFLMGAYLAIIGTADLVYRDRYIFNDVEWKRSAACSVAGFLSMFSSEVSAFNICLITLDRFLVLRFPLGIVHFGRRSALVACCIMWVAGLVLAAIPLLPFTSHWQFFGQNSICIPMPFTSSDRFRGYTYSFVVMIVLNFVLFILIAIGQAVIYWSVRVQSMARGKTSTLRDAKIARRLTAVVLSDFLCWFPIGLLGVLASTGTQIPGEVSVAMAVFMLPFNSALNPFLYTFNMLLEKRQRAQEEHLLKKLEKRVTSVESTHRHISARNQADLCQQSFGKSGAVANLQACLKDTTLSAEEIVLYLRQIPDVTREDVVAQLFQQSVENTFTPTEEIAHTPV